MLRVVGVQEARAERDSCKSTPYSAVASTAHIAHVIAVVTCDDMTLYDALYLCACIHNSLQTVEKGI